MKIQLVTLAIALSTGNAFAPISSAKRTLTFLNADVNYMWAFDAYGRPDGELPSPEVMYGEGDPWYFKPNSGGIGQSDFYPLGDAGNRLTTTPPTAGSVPLPAATSAPVAATTSAPPLPAAEKEEAMPELDASMSAYDQAMAQASSA